MMVLQQMSRCFPLKKAYLNHLTFPRDKEARMPVTQRKPKMTKATRMLNSRLGYTAGAISTLPMHIEKSSMEIPMLSICPKSLIVASTEEATP